MAKRQQPKIQLYTIISRAVEEGVAYGLQRFNKYSPRPLNPEQTDAAAEHLEREVLNSLCEVFDFGDK